MAGPTSLNTLTDLYEMDSQLLQELPSGTTTNVHLNPLVPDHFTLITDISIQLSDPERLYKMLHLDKTQFERIVYDHKGCAEQIFQLLYTWICDRKPTIAEVCTVLGVTGITPTANDDSNTIQIRERLREWRVSLSDELLLKLSLSLQGSWQFIARFLGIPEVYITKIMRESPHKCEEQAFEMLKEWQMKQGDRATYDHIFIALMRLWSFESMRGDVHTAYDCFLKYVDIHLKI